MKIKRKKLLAWVLSAALLGTAPGTILYAEENAEQEKAETPAALCEHHPEHDESCGYQEVREEIPCTCGYDPASETGHEGSTDEKAGQDAADEPKGHAENCAYEEAMPGAPCTFVCPIYTQPENNEKPEDNKEPEINKEPEVDDPLPDNTDDSTGPDSEDSGSGSIPGSDTEPLDEESAAKEPEAAAVRIIASWTWDGQEDILSEGVLSLPAGSEEAPLFIEDVQSLLPKKILASIEPLAADDKADGEETEAPATDENADSEETKVPATDENADNEETKAPATDENADDEETEVTEESVTLESWSCPEYPEEGAYAGSYVFLTRLPEGFVLAEGTKELTVTVEFAPAAEYDFMTEKSESTDASAGLIYETASYLPLEETTYQAGSGQMIWKPVVENGCAVRGELILKDAQIHGGTMGIWLPVSTEIVLEGTSKITVENSPTENKTGRGIYLNNISNSEELHLTIRGTGSLEIDSEGSGISTTGSITVDRAGQLLITYGSGSQGGNGLNSTGTGHPITIQNCGNVKIRSRDGMTGHSSGAIYHQNLGEIIIENSHVILANLTGPAIHTAGDLRCVSSDIKAIGNTSNNYVEGTLNFGHLTAAGGTMYLENTGSDEVLPLVQNAARLEEGAVIYCKKVSYVPWLQGDGIWYMSCSYDEAADEITGAGVGNVIGNVVWNEHIRFFQPTILNIGSYADASLTIPEEMTVEIPNGCMIYNKGGSNGSYTGTLTNLGTLNVLDGGTLQNGLNDNIFTNKGTLHIQTGGKFFNTYDPNVKTGGTVQNQGHIKTDAGTMFQNQSLLENSGIMDCAAGSFYNVLLPGYDAVINNTGTINGFVTEAKSTCYTYTTYGNTVLGTRQMLTLQSAANQVTGMALQVAAGTSLTIEDSAIVDARTNLTKENIAQYLSINGNLIVNGQLWLPNDPPEEILETLTGHLSGTGTVLIGNSPDAAHYIVSVSESGASSSGNGLYRPGDTVTINAGLRNGFRFKGWRVSEDVSLENTSALQTTFVMPEHSVQITAQWEIPVTDVRLDRISLSMLPGDTALLHMTILPSDASNQNAVWTSDHPETASVDPDGKVTALAPGLAKITVTTSDGQKTASCTVQVQEIQEPPKPPTDTEDTQLKLVFTQGMTEIPLTLCEKGLDTQEKIETAFRLEISQKHASFAGKNEALYDVTLLVRRQGSSVWEKADASNFPSDGKLQVILPYPEGTGQNTHDFLAAHMFTSSDFGKIPGQMEFPNTVKTRQGIQFEVTGLSPIFLSWKEIPKPSGGGSHSSESSGSSAGSPSSHPSPAGADTGDTELPWLWLLSALLSAAGICLLQRKRKNRIIL